jgi:phosphatidylserine decarboxylase
MMHISKEGVGTIIGVGVFAGLLGFLGFSTHNNVMIVLFILNIICFLFCIYFFRDPFRKPPDDPKAIVAPADGKVVNIDKVEEEYFIQGRTNRISIFLSIFNVHVNYIPMSGSVEYFHYKRGKFLPAFKPEASEENQHTLVGLDTRYGPLVFKQAAGILARRVVCHLRFGDRVKTGQKFGIIKFGSRMDVFLPDWAEIRVKKGDCLRAGESIIAYVNEKK